MNDNIGCSEKTFVKVKSEDIFKAPESREEVVERLFGKLWDDSSAPCVSGEYSVKRAEEIIALATFAQQGSELVYLNPEDAQILVKYIKEN